MEKRRWEEGGRVRLRGDGEGMEIMTIWIRFKPHWFWDGQAMIITRGMMELVNGFDEVKFGCFSLPCSFLNPISISYYVLFVASLAMFFFSRSIFSTI